MKEFLKILPAIMIHTAIQFPMFLLGLILIPVMAKLKRYEMRESRVFKGTIVSAWKDGFMYPWSNEEDGIFNGKQYYDAGSDFKQIVYWSAFRNPVNNLRYIKGFSLKIDPSKVTYIGSKVNDIREYDYNTPMWYICRQGYKGNFRVQFKLFKRLFRIWVGWKVYPEDTLGPVTGHRAPGAGVAYQLKKLDETRLTQ